MRITRAIFVFGLFLIIQFSCSKNPANPEETHKYDGTWNGTTNQNEPMTFTINESVITFIAIKVNHPNGRIEGDARGKLGNVINDSFSLTLSWSLTINVNGTFESATICKGNFILSNASGTWTAHRN